MNNPFITITIIGFGHVGRLLAYRLLAFGSQYHFLINIIDPARDIKGSFLDISHAAGFHSQHKITLNDFSIMEKSDFIFHCAGPSVPINASRLSIVKESIRMTSDIFENFRSKTDPYIIVISNPVDIVSYHLHQLTGHKVIGTGTLIDTLRMKHCLSGILQVNSDEVETLMLGEHGNSVVWARSLSMVGGEPLNNVLTDEIADQCMDQVLTAATEIKKTQGATYYGVVECGIRILSEILNPSGKILPLSILVPDTIQQLLECREIFFGLPARITSKGVVPVKDFQLNQEELIELKKSARILSDSL